MLGQEIPAADADNPVLTEKHDTRPAIGFQERWRPRKRLKIAARILATCTIAGGADDRLANRFQLNTSAHAVSGPDLS